MLENRVIARLPRAMMAALSTAIGRWVITRSSLPLHLASKIPEPPLKTRRAVITRSFFVSTAFNLNRPSPLPLPSSSTSSLYLLSRSVPFLSFPFLPFPTRKLGRFISSSNNLSSISFLPSYSVRPARPKPVALSDWPRFILQDDMLLRGISGNGCSFDGRGNAWM